MITTPDLISLPFPPDLTQAGIVYACRSLPHTYDRMGGSDFDRLRRIVTGIAVELAFRRHLTAQKIPYDTFGATPFTDPDRYDVAIGGHLCDLKSFQVFQISEIQRIRREPSRLLRSTALVPVDQVMSEHMQDNDLYVFACATAQVSKQKAEIKGALLTGQAAFILHPMSETWSHPRAGISLGKVVLKTDLDQPIELELGGQGITREFLTEKIFLPPRTPVAVQGEYTSLAYLHSLQLPAGRIGIHSSGLKLTHLIPASAWGNIWVNGLQVTLIGYMRRGEFRRRARLLPAGSRVMQYSHTRTDNMALPAADLEPLGKLFEYVKGKSPHFPC